MFFKLELKMQFEIGFKIISEAGMSLLPRTFKAIVYCTMINLSNSFSCVMTASPIL